MCVPWDSQANEKMQFLFLLLFALTLIRNENITSEECETKKPFEIILHVGELQAFKVGFVVRNRTLMNVRV